MDAALAALIGALVGAVVPTIANLLTARQARDDARESRQQEHDREREARLFDHRREAYSTYIATANRLLDAAGEWHWGDGPTHAPDPPDDALAPLVNDRAGVSLYGTSEADQTAVTVLDALIEFTFGNGSRQSYDHAQATIEVFVARARQDLGVT